MKGERLWPLAAAWTSQLGLTQRPNWRAQGKSLRRRVPLGTASSRCAPSLTPAGCRFSLNGAGDVPTAWGAGGLHRGAVLPGAAAHGADRPLADGRRRAALHLLRALCRAGAHRGARAQDQLTNLRALSGATATLSLSLSLSLPRPFDCARRLKMVCGCRRTCSRWATPGFAPSRGSRRPSPTATLWLKCTSSMRRGRWRISPPTRDDKRA